MIKQGIKLSEHETQRLIQLVQQTRFSYKLDQYSDVSSKEILKSTQRARGEIAQKMARVSPTAKFTRERLEALSEELQHLTLATQSQITRKIAQATEIAGAASYTAQNNILSFGGLVPYFNPVTLSAAQLHSMVTKMPIGGRQLNEWVGRTFTTNIQEGIKSELLTGMLKGEGYRDMTKRFGDKVFDGLSHDVETLTKSYVQSVNVQAIDDVAKANADIVKGWKWNSVAENRTCMSCMSLDSRDEVYPLGEGPEMPQHPRCRCFKELITKTFREMGVNVDEIEKAYRPYTIRGTVDPVTGVVKGEKLFELDRMLNKTANKLAGDSIETVVVFDNKGVEIFRKKATKTKSFVRFKNDELTMLKKKQNITMIHNHPTGLSFSTQDIVFMNEIGLNEMQAVGGDYLYRAKIIKSIKTNTMKDAIDQAINSVTIRLEDAVRYGRMTKEAADAVKWHEVWQTVQKTENWFFYERTKLSSSIIEKLGAITPGKIGVGGGKVIETGRFLGTYEDFLKGQSVAVQRQILGPSRLELWQSGKVKLMDFADKNGQIKLLTELRGIPTIKKLGSLSPGLPAKSAEEILAHYEASAKATQGPVQATAADLKARVERRLGDLLYASKSPEMDEFVKFASGHYLEADRSSYHLAANNLIQQWAGTSGDKTPKSIMMQLAAEKEFGLKGVSIWWEKEILVEAKALFKIHEVAMRRFLREMYNDTQAHLAKQGLKTVRVARGYVGDIGITPSTIANKMRKVNIRLQPISSFSADFDTTRKFAGNILDENRALMFADIPANRILSCPVTGYGCKNEFEYVILGSQKEAEKILSYMLTRKQDITWGQFFGTDKKVFDTITEAIYEATK